MSEIGLGTMYEMNKVDECVSHISDLDTIDKWNEENSKAKILYFDF